MKRVRRLSGIFGLAIVGTTLLISRADGKAPTELDRALGAAVKARATPKGEAYHQAAMLVFRDIIALAIKDCGITNAPGVATPVGFKAVLIISRSAKLKWVVRDPKNPLSNCFLSKTVGLTFPPPPGDNWPVLFQIN